MLEEYNIKIYKTDDLCIILNEKHYKILMLIISYFVIFYEITNIYVLNNFYKHALQYDLNT